MQISKSQPFSSQLAIEYILNVLYSCIFLVAISIRITHHKNTPTSILKFLNKTKTVLMISTVFHNQGRQDSNLRPLGPKPSALPS